MVKDITVVLSQVNLRCMINCTVSEQKLFDTRFLVFFMGLN